MTTFEFKGNHRDPKGNPLGYHRTTTRQKWDPKYRDYQEYKEWLRQKYWLIQNKFSSDKPFQDPIRCLVKVEIAFAKENHADPDNVGKAILDALFVNDKEVDLCTSHTCKNGQSSVKVTIIPT